MPAITCGDAAGGAGTSRGAFAMGVAVGRWVRGRLCRRAAFGTFAASLVKKIAAAKACNKSTLEVQHLQWVVDFSVPIVRLT